MAFQSNILSQTTGPQKPLQSISIFFATAKNSSTISKPARWWVSSPASFFPAWFPTNLGGELRWLFSPFYHHSPRFLHGWLDRQMSVISLLEEYLWTAAPTAPGKLSKKLYFLLFFCNGLWKLFTAWFALYTWPKCQLHDTELKLEWLLVAWFSASASFWTVFWDFFSTLGSIF